MEYLYEFLLQGWADPRETGTYQTLHGLLMQSGDSFFEAFGSMNELEAHGKLTRTAADGKTVYLWATPLP
jgi:hypothetical protein